MEVIVIKSRGCFGPEHSDLCSDEDSALGGCHHGNIPHPHLNLDLVPGYF
jgi:hypothetical protein